MRLRVRIFKVEPELYRMPTECEGGRGTAVRLSLRAEAPQAEGSRRSLLGWLGGDGLSRLKRARALAAAGVGERARQVSPQATTWRIWWPHEILSGAGSTLSC